MNKILFIDTLTTGLNTERCAIYRIGGIFCTEAAEGIREEQRFELFMQPHEGARIMDNSLWLGGMTRSKLIYFPTHQEAFKDFMDLVKGQINIRNAQDKLYIAGFNASSFDVPFLRYWFERNNNKNFRDCFYVQTLDIMCLSAFALINERENMPDFHLETAAKYLGVNPEKNKQYSCLDNALTCLKMYSALKRKLCVGDDRKYKPTEKIFRNYEYR